MSLKYLNLTGLSRVITNLKNWVVSQIPTKTSEITNDSGFLTSHQSLDGKMTRGSYERIEGNSSNHKDLNDYIIAGFYNVKTAYVDNCPTGIERDAALLVYPWNAGSYCTQEITETAASTHSRRWIRKLNSTTWSDWVAVAFHGDNLSAFNNDSGFITSSSLPTVNNATLTIQKNGTNVQTFTANASSNKTANITVPTKTSELTNDSGFLTSHQSLSNYVTLNSNQTLTSTKTFTTNINTTSTATSQRETWRLIFNKDSADTDSTTAAQLGVVQVANSHDFYAILRLANPRANNKPTTENTKNCWSGIGVFYNYDENRGRPYAQNCWDWPASSNSSYELASTSWVRTYCETTKGFLTSHQTVSNSAPTLAWGATATIGTIGGTALTVKMPANPNTNTTYSAGTGLSLSGTTFSLALTKALVTDALGYTPPTQDTVYTHPTTAGNKHIPSGGSANQYLKYSASGTAVWANLPAIPTKTSELTNDSGFLTSHQSLSNYVTLNGTQTISGGKTFSKSFGDGDPSILIQSSTAYANGTWNYPLATLAPNMKAGANLFMPIGRNFAAGNCAGWHWCYAGDNSNDNYVSVEFYAVGSHFAVYRDGRVFLSTTPATSDNSTRVATTAYVKNQGYLSGTVPIANGGTGATTRLGAVRKLTEEHVGTDTEYFLTITQNWGKAGYCSVADAKTVLGIGTTSKKLTLIGERETAGTWTLTCTTLAPIYFKIIASKTSSSAEFVCGITSSSTCRFVMQANNYDTPQIIYSVVSTSSSGVALWGIGIPTSTSITVEVWARNTQYQKVFNVKAYQ